MLRVNSRGSEPTQRSTSELSLQLKRTTQARKVESMSVSLLELYESRSNRAILSHRAQAGDLGLARRRPANSEDSLFEPKVEILPQSQRTIWNELKTTPRHFVLYGGTAIALRLGHRQSEDFDFFSNEAFQPAALIEAVGYLKQARIDQRGDNTLTVVTDRGGPVRISYFGGLGMNHVHEPDLAADNGLQIASLLDLAATKLKTIQQRAEAKDYRDIDAVLGSGVSLPEGLAAAVAVYGKAFNPLMALKALSYFKDGNLPSLSSEIQARLLKAVNMVKLEGLPRLTAKPGIARSGSSI